MTTPTLPQNHHHETIKVARVKIFQGNSFSLEQTVKGRDGAKGRDGLGTEEHRASGSMFSLDTRLSSHSHRILVVPFLCILLPELFKLLTTDVTCLKKGIHLT